MRWWLLLAVAGGLLPVALPVAKAMADDDLKPEQLRKMYGEVVEQLKNAQERKNQLATENEQLKAKLVELQKQLEAGGARSAELEEALEDVRERADVLRRHYAAWHEFIRRYPSLMIRWKVFLQNNLWAAPQDSPPFDSPQPRPRVEG